MAKVALTQAQRDEARVQRQLERIADGLTTYKRHNRLTVQTLAAQLGVGRYTAGELLAGRPVTVPTDRLWRILSAAGLKVEERRVDLDG